MQLTPERGVLRYVLEREYSVAGIRLFPGDITYAFYWPDRPYTLYIWQTRSHGTSYYFNIADSISLTPEMFIWRDLVIDILVTDRSHPRVLDEEELPRDLSPRLGSYIRSATSLVLSSYQSVLQEAQSVISSIPVPY